jgi:hypothetical protein
MLRIKFYWKKSNYINIFIDFILILYLISFENANKKKNEDKKLMVNDMRGYLKMQIEEKLIKKEEIERDKILERKNIIVKEESNLNNILVEKEIKKIKSFEYKKMLDEQINKKKPFDFMTKEEFKINLNLIKQNPNQDPIQIQNQSKS